MDPHLDAEQLAAFAEGSLSRAERAAVEAHAADCARCLRLLAAMARTDVAPSGAQRAGRRRWSLPAVVRWGVPLAGGATALALWINVSPDRRDDRVAEPARMESPRAAPDASTSGSRSAESVLPPATAAPEPIDRLGAPRSETAREPRQTAAESTAAKTVGRRDAKEVDLPLETRKPDSSQERADLQARTRRMENAARAPAAAGGIAAAIEVVSPDPVRRWRVSDTVVQRSTDGGQTWIAQPTPAHGDILAGSSPSADVAWLVGRAGTILITSDGSRWQRVDFPNAVDLIAVRATSAREAEVTSADGRVFQTTDGGRSWSTRDRANSHDDQP